MFQSYGAVVETMKKTFGITLPMESQVSEKSRMGYQTEKGWVNIHAVPVHNEPIKLFAL
jgi:hypothetical protein